MTTKATVLGALPLLLAVTQGCSNEVLGGVQGSGGGGQRAFAWVFSGRPQGPTINSNDATIDEAAICVLIGDGDRTCQDPYLLSDGSVCTPDGCVGPVGWQLAFVVPPVSQKAGATLEAGDAALHLELSWAKPPANNVSATGVDEDPYGSGSVEVVSVDSQGVTVRFAGLTPTSGAETLGAEAALDGNTFLAPLNCK